jgi:hypothetical protein
MAGQFFASRAGSESCHQSLLKPYQDSGELVHIKLGNTVQRHQLRPHTRMSLSSSSLYRTIEAGSCAVAVVDAHCTANVNRVFGAIVIDTALDICIRIVLEVGTTEAVVLDRIDVTVQMVCKPVRSSAA